jgi:hypothetical protein
LKRQVRSSDFGITKHNPTVACRFSRYIVQDTLPKCRHTIKFVTMNDNRANPHRSRLPYYFTCGKSLYRTILSN